MADFRRAIMKPTLRQVFGLTLLGLALVLGLLFFVVYHLSLETTVESSERIRDAASREIVERVSNFLATAPAAVAQFQEEANCDLVDPRKPDAIEAALFVLQLSKRDISEATFTYGKKIGFDQNGALQLAVFPRGQVSVMRSLDAEDRERFWSREVHQENGTFVAEQRELKPNAPLSSLPFARQSGVKISDPTLHPTFLTPARKDFSGQLLWSDLHWSQLDAALPEMHARAEVSVQQTINDSAGKFAGVLRVGLLTNELDRAVQLKIGTGGTIDPHRIFICDAMGRLVTRLSPKDRLQEVGSDLRIAPAHLPPEVIAAVSSPALHSLNERTTSASGQFEFLGEEYLTTFRALSGTQDWIVGIVVPRAYYAGRLITIRDQLLGVSLVTMALLLAGGGFILRRVQRAHSQIVRESLTMNAFEFSPSSTEAPFRDISEVLESLETAKTAMRAMSKYVPVDLVRRLYRSKTEPVLGAELTQIAIMFTDIQDFTTHSERLAPNELANALGSYLQLLVGIIQRETGGTIDKFIGDAIMAFWNAPEPIVDPARMACLAALRCRAASHALSRSPTWRGRPAFETRFGLHQGQAQVGHFGAPDRLNYTAIGDAVNLASRLESLNKQYGTAIIASAPIFAATRAEFDFRLLDKVAVKGKIDAIEVYELLGEKGTAAAMRQTVTAYENALAAYMGRKFADAMDILAAQPNDPPSCVLHARCREFQQAPPPSDWGGAFVSMSK
ncbi:MAG TPA: adenylate/guanylate cyclase domain-containing protein [Chthoniobacterales bacterium]